MVEYSPATWALGSLDRFQPCNKDFFFVSHIPNGNITGISDTDIKVSGDRGAQRPIMRVLRLKRRVCAALKRVVRPKKPHTSTINTQLSRVQFLSLKVFFLVQPKYYLVETADDTQRPVPAIIDAGGVPPPDKGGLPPSPVCKKNPNPYDLRCA